MACPPARFRIFISMKFQEARDEALALKSALQQRGISTFVCDDIPTAEMARSVISAIDTAELVVILGTETYGAETSSTFSTHDELAFIINQRKPFYLVKLCDRFVEAGTRFWLPTSLPCFTWKHPSKVRSVIPPHLLEDILRKLEEIKDQPHLLPNQAALPPRLPTLAPATTKSPLATCISINPQPSATVQPSSDLLGRLTTAAYHKSSTRTSPRDSLSSSTSSLTTITPIASPRPSSIHLATTTSIPEPPQVEVKSTPETNRSNLVSGPATPSPLFSPARCSPRRTMPTPPHLVTTTATTTSPSMKNHSPPASNRPSRPVRVLPTPTSTPQGVNAQPKRMRPLPCPPDSHAPYLETKPIPVGTSSVAPVVTISTTAVNSVQVNAKPYDPSSPQSSERATPWKKRVHFTSTRNNTSNEYDSNSTTHDETSGRNTTTSTTSATSSSSSNNTNNDNSSNNTNNNNTITTSSNNPTNNSNEHHDRVNLIARGSDSSGVALKTLREHAMHMTVLTLIEFLQACGAYADVHVEGYRLLRHVADDPAKRKEIGALGGIQMILRAMQAHDTRLDLQSASCSTLARLVVDSDNRQILLNQNGLDIVLNVMKQHVEDVSLQTTACQLLLNLAVNEWSRRKLVRVGAISVLLSTIKQHMINSNAQQHVWEALRKLALDVPNRRPCVRQGGIQLAVAAMRRHRTDPWIQLHGCGFLGQVTVEQSGQRWSSLRANAVQAILAAMKTHDMLYIVQKEACKSLWSLAHASNHNRRTIARLGGIEMILTVVRTHGVNVALLEQACGVLQDLVRESRYNRKRFGQAGGIPVLLTAMKDHPEQREIQIMACATLHHLSLNSRNLKQMRAQQASAVVEQAMSTHANDAKLGEICKLLLERLN
eukprot:m.7224 g.7224  ORF g.7224 m.7224 type:complete len:884 (+) comp5125_c0_seq2:974-3625(+)